MKFIGASLAIVCLASMAVVSSTRAADPAPTPKVAVLVSAGDGGGGLEDAFQAEERAAQAVYEKLGFKVIVIGGVTRRGLPLTPTTFAATLNDLSGVKDLRVDFIGHGGLSQAQASHSGHGISLSKERLENGYQLEGLKPDEKIIWSAANSVTADDSQFGAKAKRLGLSTASSEPLDQEHIANALNKFHKRNPLGIATLNLTNCYSGALAQRLRKDPGTIVYADAPHNSVALSMADEFRDQGVTNSAEETSGRAFLGADSGLGRYYQLLNGNYLNEERKVSRGSLDFETIRTSANNHQAVELRSQPDEIYNVGRSPLFESVVGWCEEGHALSTVSRAARDDCDDETSQDKVKSSIACKLKSEAKELNRRLTYAANSPTHDGQSTMAASLERNYQKCMSKMKSPLADMKMLGQNISASLKSLTQNAYPNNPMQPIQMMIASFEKILANPAEHSAIVKRFKNVIEGDFAELRKMNLPEERWGGLRQLLVGLKNKTIGETQIISKIKLQLENLKKDCASGDPFKAPCVTDGFLNLNDLSGYLFDLFQNPADPAIEKCSGKPQRFDCIYAINSRHSQLVIELNDYWSSAPRKPAARPLCQKHPWIQYAHAKKNVELDTKCVGDFIANASEDEWDNLKRLLELGKRDARGNSAEPANASPRPLKTDAGKILK